MADPKICTGCQQSKPATDFYPRPGGKVEPRCKPCELQRAREGRARRRAARARDDLPESKSCFSCKQTKPASAFWRNGNHTSGLNTYCKECMQVAARLRRYGVTAEAYTALLHEQEGACALCRAAGVPLVVDHCHTSARVRGLLCNRCNGALEFVERGDEFMLKVKEYLRRG